MLSACRPRGTRLVLGPLFVGLLVMLTMGLGSCRQPPVQPTTTPAAVEAMATQVVTRTPSPWPSPTATALPSATATPSPTPTPTATATPLLAPDGQARVARVPILMYHYVGGLPADADAYRVDLTVPPERFEAQLAYLQAAGYTGISLENLVRHLAEGAPLPPKPIVLTFDDGYIDNFLYAFPLLRQYGFAGTFFIITGFVDEGRAGYFGWEQARIMQDSGMDIQSHSVTHPDLRGKPESSLVHEIAASRQAIEERLQKPARLFAYPFGRYDRQVVDMLRSAGYWAAVTTAAGVEHSTAGLFELSRVRVHGAQGLDRFKATLDYYER